MDTDIEAAITPVDVAIESETYKYTLGVASRAALLGEQVDNLIEALDAIVDYASLPVAELNRAQHEDLAMWLNNATKASNAIWWLIPADVYTADDE